MAADDSGQRVIIAARCRARTAKVVGASREMVSRVMEGSGRTRPGGVIENRQCGAQERLGHAREPAPVGSTWRGMTFPLGTMRSGQRSPGAAFVGPCDATGKAARPCPALAPPPEASAWRLRAGLVLVSLAWCWPVLAWPRTTRTPPSAHHRPGPRVNNRAGAIGAWFSEVSPSCLRPLGLVGRAGRPAWLVAPGGALAAHDAPIAVDPLTGARAGTGPSAPSC